MDEEKALQLLSEHSVISLEQTLCPMVISITIRADRPVNSGMASERSGCMASSRKQIRMAAGIWIILYPYFHLRLLNVIIFQTELENFPLCLNHEIIKGRLSLRLEGEGKCPGLAFGSGLSPHFLSIAKLKPQCAGDSVTCCQVKLCKVILKCTGRISITVN